MTEIRFRFTKRQKLVQQLDFDRVFKHGKVGSNETLVIHAVLRTDATTRLGISISKLVGNSPMRNRWKRLIRESFRLQQAELPKGLDIVVRPRRGASPEYQHVFESLPKILNKLHRQLNYRPTPPNSPNA